MDEKIAVLELAKNIIETNQYASMSTIFNNSPWANTIAYVFDTKYNFYFVSKPNSKHSENIKTNKKVMLTIYDSHQPFGDGIGLQIEGMCDKCSLLESAKVLKLYFSRKWIYGSPTNFPILKKLIKNETFVFYKITTTKFMMLDPNSDEEERIEVKIKND